MQGLYLLLPNDDRELTMVFSHPERCILHVDGMPEVRGVRWGNVILPVGTKGGTVVPPCDFQYSNTLSPVFIGVSRCFPSRAAPARAHTHPCACIIAAEQA